MAIAFRLPSDECTLDHYRRIQQLLMDLIDLLRTLITTETPVTAPSPSPNPPVPASGSQFGFPTPPSSVPNSPSPFSPSATSATSAFPLPDVVSSSATIEELRNFLISRSFASSATGPVVAAPVQVANVPVPQSIETEPQVIPEEMVVNQNGGSVLAKLRKRKRARVSRKKKGCPECCQNEPTLALPSSSPIVNQSNQATQATSSCYDNRTNTLPTTKTTQNECSCNDVSMSGTEDTCVSNAKAAPNHRQHHHHHHHRQHHQITRNYVPNASNSEFYMDPAYCRRIAAAATDEATGGDCKSSYSWVEVAEELRRMSDTNKKDGKLSKDMSESKGLNGLISQCGRTVFAAALLVLGWKLLKQN